MELRIHKNNNGNVAELISPNLLIDYQDFIDLIGNASYLHADKIILKKESLKADFFDLKTKFAGEILQKFSTYNLKLAIIGDFSLIKSKSLKDFIRESNRVGRILFLDKIEHAFEIFSN